MLDWRPIVYDELEAYGVCLTGGLQCVLDCRPVGCAWLKAYSVCSDFSHVTNRQRILRWFFEIKDEM